MIILASFVLVIGTWIALSILRTMVATTIQVAAIFSGGRELQRPAPAVPQAAKRTFVAEPAMFPAPGPPPPLSDYVLSLDDVQAIWKYADVDSENGLPSLLASEEYVRKGLAIPVAIGLTAGGDPLVIDIASAPHVLIGGTTGSGKSVLQHALIVSLIHKHGPRTLRLLLVDTKGLELTPYNGLPHLRHPVITQPAEAVLALRWVAREVSARMALLRANHCRNIAEFNEAVRSGESVLVQPTVDTNPKGGSGELAGEAYLGDVLPYLVMVIDDLADLGAQSGEVHVLLSAIAQAGRAVGVHLVCVTQRPSAAVVAGDAKALFPTRIAFRLPAAVDSRIVLDKTGAERLEGAGAMIVVSGDNPAGVAVRGVPMTAAIVDLVPVIYAEQGSRVPQLFPVESNILVGLPHDAAPPDDGRDGARDTLFREAAELCIQHRGGSTSLLQRRFGIGYGRAARVLDQLSDAGVLDSRSGPNGREVRVGLEDLDRICGDR